MTSVQFLLRLVRLLRVVCLFPREWSYLRLIRRSRLFDRAFYRHAYPQLNWLYRLLPEHHFIAYGEGTGFEPNADFSALAYLRHNPDVAAAGMAPFRHYLLAGRYEIRIYKDLPAAESVPDSPELPLPRLDPDRVKAPQAIALHLHYPDLWPEFRADLLALELPFDLYVTLSWQGEKSLALKEVIEADFPEAVVCYTENRGRDILPFLRLVTAGFFEGYRAVAKIHGKKSPHRVDGDRWRRHLVEGILSPEALATAYPAFLADPDVAIWVADGQHFKDERWWGSNRERLAQLLARVEIGLQGELAFPAGSIYWLKPLMISMLAGLRLEPWHFEREAGQFDGTLAHAVERSLGFLAKAAGQKICETAELSETELSEAGRTLAAAARPLALRPRFTSAFYLPQFHPIAENDRWWGKGYTEWQALQRSPSNFAGHLHRLLPKDLGFYDLRATEVMGEQAAYARQAGIDGFCVYHYWFDGKTLLDQPLERLLARPEIDFPFYLAWANESWRRNWDGLSGEVLMGQSYQPGFETALAAHLARYMRDPRYMRPDGRHPRFVIYRPEDLPDPALTITRLRQAFRQEGIGEVELGAVHFHLPGEQAVEAGLFDFWIEMPPHGTVRPEHYLFGGAQGNMMPCEVEAGFAGVIYDYRAVAAHTLEPDYVQTLPANTIAGIMPSWDNSARRGRKAHIAYGANPARFRHWLDGMLKERIAGSYQGELFINAWNEWGEKAMLEPSDIFGRAYLEVIETAFSHAQGIAPAAPVSASAAFADDAA